MAHKIWDRNDAIRVKVTFKDTSGLTVDPTTVTFKYIKPDSVAIVTKVYLTDAEVIRQTKGIFYIDLIVDVEGIWRWRWEATGAAVAADEGSFGVKDSEFYAA